MSRDQYEIDCQQTLENREKLARNANLLYWYEQLYRHQFEGIADVRDKTVLEIGSGTSPLKRFYPKVLTSDVLDLDYLDYVFDCHDIARVAAIRDGSVDVITMTNVLHHLRDPIKFLNDAAVKLRAGGKVIATEPLFSRLSSPLWRYLHHEPVDFAITEPRLDRTDGPLSSANIALPFLIFKKRSDWLARLRSHYEPAITSRPFTALAYMATGGISRRWPVPGSLYRALFAADRRLSELAPNLVAAFFTVILVKRARTADSPPRVDGSHGGS